jgi:hypothetical protein
MKLKLHKLMNIILATIGIAFAIACVGYFRADTFVKGMLVSIWLLAPPVYFYGEWVFLYKESEEYPFDKFKYSQKLARDIWLAISVILIALYFNGFKFR